MDEKIMGKIFYKNTAALICLLLAMFCFSGSSLAKMQEAELFEKAYEYYLAFNPEMAIETFDLFLQQYPASSALDSVLFWRAKSLMQIKRAEEAAKGFQKLREVFPESSYAIFAEKELETLKNMLQKVDKSDAVREKTAKTPDAKMPGNEDRIKKLETEVTDLEKQLSEAEKKRQLTEKGLSKALDDKNALEAQLDELKRVRDDLARKAATFEKGARESTGLTDEKRALELRLKASEEKSGSLSAELARSEEKIAAITKELSSKIQQGQKDWERLDLLAKELKAQNVSLDAALKEKDKALADAHQAMAAMKKSATDSQYAKQRDIESLNQTIAKLSAEKVFFVEELAVEKKRANDLAVTLQGKDETMKRLLSDEAKRKTSNSADEERLKHSAAELVRVQGERDGLQSSIKSLETRLKEKNDLAGQAGDIKKLREEIASITAELERIRKDNTALLDDKKRFELRLAEDQEKAKTNAFNRDKEAEKEKKALLTEARELEKKLRDATTQIRQLQDDRQKIDAALKERDQSLAKSQESTALLEKTLKGTELDKAKQLQELEARNRTADTEKKALQDELAKEKRRVAEFSDKVTDREASLLNEIKTLQSSRQELETKLAVENSNTKDEKRKLETERDSLRRQLQDLDTRSTKAKDVLSQLEESRKKQEELSKVAALNDKEIAKLRAEKSDLETRLKDIEERAKVLSGIKQRDERTTAEKRDLEQRLTEERAKFDADTQTISAERDELKKQLEVLETLRKDKEELAARLDETKRLYADAQGKGGQAEKILQDNLILNNEKKQLEIRLNSSEEKIAALTSQRDKGAVLESGRKDLAARFDEQEKKVKEQQSLISRLMVEKGGMEKDLKDGKQEIATAKALKESRDLLQVEVDRMRIEQKQMKADLDEMKRMNEQHATRNSDLIREVSTLRTQSLDFEKPFLRIGKERYDLAAVMSEGRTARNVTDKIQVKNVPWRTGNIIDDFITEQILARKAQEGTSSDDASVKDTLVKQYALNAPEGAYLVKYLAIDGLIRKRVAAPAISEKEAREYYEKHRDQYLQGRDNRIRVLSVRYGKADELEKSLIAVEIMQEVQDGRTFDTVARRRAAVAVMKEMSLSRLPDWARVKIAGLKEGEISNIISVDNEFMIIQAISSKPAYRSFEEVRKEIEKKLSAELSGRQESLHDWLHSLKKDIEFLRQQDDDRH